MLDPDERIVAPFVGAWVEIMLALKSVCPNNVAPFVGAWVEILIASAL